ncbi:energy transducer TonB [Altererythrobacter sp. GH1-8]|uniref:energy transducer TonB n=1 Tax=Altererythrobacter sp. GH1-8 TaxID=3349333 RepID=UPI00374DF90F
MRFAILAIPVIVGLGLILTPSLSAWEKAPESYNPIGPWVFDYADDHCAFRRSFESQSDKFFVEFRQYTPGPSFDLIAMSEKLRTRGRDFEFRFAPYKGTIKPSTAYPMTGDGNASGHFGVGYFHPPVGFDMSDDEIISMADDDLRAWLEGIEALEIVSGFSKFVRLETGSFSDLITVRTHCLNTLLKEWGLDPDRIARQTRPPVPKDAESWVRAVKHSYPRAALNRGKVGATRLRLMVGMDGRVTSCTSLANIADRSLSDAACKAIIEHATFEPALDENGVPMASYHIQPVSFRIS